MGKKGKVGRLKRKPAPRFWPIHRKESIWVVRPSSGPHSLEKCLPLSIVLRDILKVAETRKEAKKIVTQGKVQVDGKVRLKDDFPIGLMDVISLAGSNKFYRVLPSHKGLFPSQISKEEADFKLMRVEDKIIIKNGYSQIALHDGTNINVKVEDPEKPSEFVYETFSTLKLGLPEKQVLDQLKTKEGNIAIITGGKNIGKHGKIVEIEKTVAKKRRNALVVVEDEKGDRCQTILDFIFSIGEAKSLISLPEANVVV